jgi:hypothetical protein
MKYRAIGSLPQLMQRLATHPDSLPALHVLQTACLAGRACCFNTTTPQRNASTDLADQPFAASDSSNTSLHLLPTCQRHAVQAACRG